MLTLLSYKFYINGSVERTLLRIAQLLFQIVGVNTNPVLVAFYSIYSFSYISYICLDYFESTVLLALCVNLYLLHNIVCDLISYNSYKPFYLAQIKNYLSQSDIFYKFSCFNYTSKLVEMTNGGR